MKSLINVQGIDEIAVVFFFFVSEISEFLTFVDF